MIKPTRRASSRNFINPQESLPFQKSCCCTRGSFLQTTARLDFFVVHLQKRVRPAAHVMNQVRAALREREKKFRPETHRVKNKYLY